MSLAEPVAFTEACEHITPLQERVLAAVPDEGAILELIAADARQELRTTRNVLGFLAAKGLVAYAPPLKLWRRIGELPVPTRAPERAAAPRTERLVTR